ncbi:MAG: hypothetical protein ACQEUG_17720 [Pseudomonadota bacterium]
MILKNLLKKSALVVRLVRFARRFQAVFFGRIQRKRASRILENYFLVTARDASNKENIFVGYYDHSPFKPDDESIILVHSTAQPAWKKPSPDVPVLIKLVYWKTGEVVSEIGESLSWNWQQGARALWFDSKTVIFNFFDSREGSYRSKLVNIENKEETILPIPVQECDSAGRVYGISYEVLSKIRPDYGYRNVTNGEKYLFKNTIEQYDVKTGVKNTLVKVNTLLADAQNRNQGIVKYPKFNHVMSSPDAKKIIFLFRYFVNDERITDLYVFDLSSNELWLVLDNCSASHACWWDNESIVVTMYGPSGFGYYRVDVYNCRHEIIWNYSDGHPVRLNKDYFLTDTYPDSKGLRKLLIVSVLNEYYREVASVPEPLLYQGETRCDLHPSISHSGRWIQVDCAIGHRRAVCILENPMYSKKSST